MRLPNPRVIARDLREDYRAMPEGKVIVIGQNITVIMVAFFGTAWGVQWALDHTPLPDFASFLASMYLGNRVQRGISDWVAEA